MSQQDENSSDLTQQIEEQEEFIQSLILELRRARNIECPTLRGITPNFLQAIISRALAKLRQLRQRQFIQKAIRSQEIFFNTTQTEMVALVTSNFAEKLFGARWLTFRKNGYVPEKSFFNGKKFSKSIFSF